MSDRPHRPPPGEESPRDERPANRTPSGSEGGRGWAVHARRAGLLVGIGVLLLVLSAAGFVVWYLLQSGTGDGTTTSGELPFPAGTRSVTLFFAAVDGDSLVAERREVPERESVSANAQTVIEELIAGPIEPRGRPLMPRGTALRHVFFDAAGNLYLDFGSAFRRNFHGGSTSEFLILQSLVRSLAANLPTVTSVTVTIEGRPVPSLGGHVSLEEPLSVAEWQ